MKTIYQLINGKIYQGEGKQFGPIYNPATGEQTAKVQFALPNDVDEAVSQAKKTFAAWSQTSPLKRVKFLSTYKSLIEKHQDDIAKLITLEHGKTLEDARGSISRGLEVVEYACNIPSLLKGEHTEKASADISCHSIRQPLGVCAGITPFNFPAMVPLWMFPLAIVCGNTFVLKPSERDPSAVIKLVELFYEAGFPEGVIQVLNGNKETVDALITHPDVMAVSSVGSTQAALHIYTKACAAGKRTQALGGAKNHAVVMPDADLTQTADILAGAAYGSTGQRCMAISVVVAVGEGTSDKLVSLLASKAKDLYIGSGLDPKTQMGPVISQDALDRVKKAIETGVQEKAHLVVDGRKKTANDGSTGFFIGASLFDKVRTDMKIYQDEIFGPVLCVMQVETLEEAIDIINMNEYGNGTAIFTESGRAANHFANTVNVGMVGVNIPIPVPVAYHSFGGWKRSAFGDRNMYGKEGIDFYTKQKTITTRWPEDKTPKSNYAMPTHD